MGRAIDQDNRLDDHERRLKLVEDALEEMIQTKVHHVDLNDLDSHERKIREENGVTVKPDGVVVEPDPPVHTHKKRTRKARATSTT